MTLTTNSIKYYCYWCNLTFCHKCGSFFDTFWDKLKVLPHKHNLIRVSGQSHSSRKFLTLDKWKIGRNLIFKLHELEGNENMTYSQDHRSWCNGCHSYIGGIRYACLTCRPGEYRKGGFHDFCGDCLEVLNNPLNPSFNRAMQSCKLSGHDPKTHCYLELYYSSGVYNEV